MIALRCLLGLSIAFLAGGLLVLFCVSNGFRASFGASKNSPLKAIVPLTAAAVLLVGLVFPGHKPLLHAGAVAAAGVLAFCVWAMVAESAVVVWLGVAWVALWGVFYWRAAFTA